MWLFFSQLSKRDSIRSTLAAVVLLQLKFSWPYTNVISFKAFSGIQPWVFHFLSNVNIQEKSHLPFFMYCCFFVVLVVSNFFALNMEPFEENCNSVLFNLHFVCTIIMLINLNNFKYPSKIRLCSQANQNHLLRDFASFSACWDKWTSALLF